METSMSWCRGSENMTQRVGVGGCLLPLWRRFFPFCAVILKQIVFEMSESSCELLSFISCGTLRVELFIDPVGLCPLGNQKLWSQQNGKERKILIIIKISDILIGKSPARCGKSFLLFFS